MKKLTFLFVPLLALVLAACSSDPAPQDTVYGLVSGDEQLTTLTTAIDTAGLDVALDGDGEYTVFAPTDDALTTVIGVVDGECPGDFTVGDLLASDLLDDILKYHVHATKLLEADLAAKDGDLLNTLLQAGDTDLPDPGLTIGANGDVTLTDKLGQTVGFVDTDIEATNGVVHIIDAVLVPVSAEDLTALCPGD